MDVFLTGNGGFDDGRVRRHAGQNQIKPFFFVNDGEENKWHSSFPERIFCLG
jgi:hypothetical protein